MWKANSIYPKVFQRYVGEKLKVSHLIQKSWNRLIIEYIVYILIYTKLQHIH